MNRKPSTGLGIILGTKKTELNGHIKIFVYTEIISNEIKGNKYDSKSFNYLNITVCIQ